MSENQESVRTAGDYALLWANGMGWSDIVRLIRADACEQHQCEGECHGTEAEADREA